MTTYRRFTCVTRSIACFLAQDYSNKELLIYNTDMEYPVMLSPELEATGLIKVINCDTDSETNQSYTNTGAIRRDARKYVNGELYITWDDDDIFFPWNIRQCVDGINRSGADAWKPYMSMFKQPGHTPVVDVNYYEASIAVFNSAIDRFGFNLMSGPEHISWFTGLQREKKLCEDINSVPAYCFYWADPPGIAGHKQSGESETAINKFQRHKQLTRDYVKTPLQLTSLDSYKSVLDDFRHIFNDYKSSKKDLFEKYIAPHPYVL